MPPILNSKILTIILSTGIVWLILSHVKLDFQKKEKEREMASVNSKIDYLKKNNEYLEKLSAYLQSSSFLEKEARSRLNYKAPGEEVVFIYQDLSGREASDSGKFKPNLKSAPNHKKWFYYLIGY